MKATTNDYKFGEKTPQTASLKDFSYFEISQWHSKSFIFDRHDTVP
jgi:hypothetical protein